MGRSTETPQTQGPQFPETLSLTSVKLSDSLRGFACCLLCHISFLFFYFCSSDKNHTSELVATFKLPLGEFWRLSPRPRSVFTPSWTLPKLFPPPGMPFPQAQILPCPSSLGSMVIPSKSLSDQPGLGRDLTLPCPMHPSLSVRSLRCVTCLFVQAWPDLGAPGRPAHPGPPASLGKWKHRFSFLSCF